VKPRRLTFPPRGTVLRQLRAAVRDHASKLGAGQQVADNLALVVDELVNNAIEHGAAYRRQNLDLAVQFEVDGDRLRIEFYDQEMPAATVAELTKALLDASNGMPSLDNERGRGLFLLTIYLEDLRAELAENGGLRLVGSIARS